MPPAAPGPAPAARLGAVSSMSHRTSTSFSSVLIERQDSHVELQDEEKGELAQDRRARHAVHMAALLTASARRRQRQDAEDAKRDSKEKPERLSAAQKQARRAEQRVRDRVRRTAEEARLRAMVRLAQPADRPVVKDVLGLSDEEYARACEGRDFDWEWGPTECDDFCCVCDAEEDGDGGSAATPTVLLAEHTSALPAPPVPDLRYGSGYEVPRQHRYWRLLRRGGPDGEPIDDRLMELCSRLLDRLRELSLTGTTDLEARRLCQLLTLERDEGAVGAIDPREMCTVPHETALRSYALHRSQREVALRAMRRDARAAAADARRGPEAGGRRNVAFGRCVPVGHAAHRKRPAALLLDVKLPPELVRFDQVWCAHVLPLRITRRFCQFLRAEHPLVPRPDALVRAGLLSHTELGMVPAAAPLRGARRPPPPP